jgi:hypothetical protein
VLASFWTTPTISGRSHALAALPSSLARSASHGHHADVSLRPRARLPPAGSTLWLPPRTRLRRSVPVKLPQRQSDPAPPSLTDRFDSLVSPRRLLAPLWLRSRTSSSFYVAASPRSCCIRLSSYALIPSLAQPPVDAAALSVASLRAKPLWLYECLGLRLDLTVHVIEEGCDPVNAAAAAPASTR